MRGTDIVKEILESNIEKEFIVYFDPDVDGAFSGVLPWKFLRDRGKHSLNLMNINRMHGIHIDLKPYVGKYATIISVDAFVPAEQVKEVVDMGFNLISLDHHECGNEFIYYKNNETGKQGVVVNNQYPFEDKEKRFLSGAGVVYEVFKEIYPELNFDWYRDTVGITLLSDVRDISNKEARGYLSYTYSSSGRNSYINYLIDECSKFKGTYSFGRPKMDRTYISFTLSPLINALLRFNRVETVLGFMTGKGLKESLVEDQKQLLQETIEGYTVTKKIGDIAIVQVEDWKTGVNMSNFIGLIANKLLGKEADSILCFIKNRDGTSRASFRSNKQEFNFLDLFKKEGYNAIGHKSAFGVLDFIETKIPVTTLAKIVSKAKDNKNDRNYIEVKNLSMFKSVGRAKKIAEENDYLMDKDKVFIKYVGNNIKLEKSTEKYKRYMVDNVPVMSFEVLEDSLSEYLIDVTTSSGLMNFIFTTFKVED